MPDVMTFRDWLLVASIVLGGMGAAVAAVAVLFGRWRAQEDKAKDGLIETLKTTTDELRAMNDELRKENAGLVEQTRAQDRKIERLNGKMQVLEWLVLKVCPSFEATDSGACAFCSRGLAYGNAGHGGPT